MSNDGPLLRILQHPYYNNNVDIHIDVDVFGWDNAVDIAIAIDAPEEHFEYIGSAGNYHAAMDKALSGILELMNERVWPYDAEASHRLRIQSIAEDNPSLTRRQS